MRTTEALLVHFPEAVDAARAWIMCMSLLCSTGVCLCCGCRESLRLDPVVAGLFRVAAKDIEMGGYLVPKVRPRQQQQQQQQEVGLRTAPADCSRVIACLLAHVDSL
jgi:hypothetical protein